MMNFSFELSEYSAAIGGEILETAPPDRSIITFNNFNEGQHFRTKVDSDSLTLDFENKLLTIVLDESGSQTWNDVNGDRYTYFTRLLNKLRDTYPGIIKSNLIGFGGVPVVSRLIVTQSSTDFLSSGQGQNLGQLLQDVFQDSVFDFAGVRIVRRTDRFPTNPSDGVIVSEGILDAVKDDGLTEGRTYFYGIWTFNKDLNFSRGKFISGSPQDRVLPRGVNFSSASPRILPGVLRDNSVQHIYSFLEKEGLVIFDSSGNGNHAVIGEEVIGENFWLGDLAGVSQSGEIQSTKDPKLNVGGRFDGDFDILEAPCDDSISFNNISGQEQFITINLWVLRYELSYDAWIIGSSTTEPSNLIGWAILCQNNGQIYIKLSNLLNPIMIWVDIIPPKTWTMITVVLSGLTASLYLNGIFSSEIAIDPDINTQDSSINKLYIGAKPVDSASPWGGGDFFGILNQISVHNVARDAIYIQQLYERESLIFGQNLQLSSEAASDNGQREVLLSWDIGTDYNFQNGQIKIIKKYRNVPVHDNDGDVVVQETVTGSGQFFFLDTENIVNGSDYYYRFFTINSLNNLCDRAEARTVATHIPPSPSTITIGEPESISNLSIQNGNKKTMLQWSNPTDTNWMGTRIFFGNKKHPTISASQNGELIVSDGFEVFDSQNSDDEFFVHRKIGVDDNGVILPLENNTFYFYTVIAYNRLNHFSEAHFITGTPFSSLDVTFPPAEVEDLYLLIVNPETLSIRWKTPIIKADNLQLFFGEAALVFVNINDIFGGGLEDLTNISLQVCTTITDRLLTTKETALGLTNSADALDGPCGGANAHLIINGGCKHGSRLEEGCNTEKEKAETVLNFSTVSSGLIKGLLTHTPDTAILTRRERYEMSIRAQYSVVDPDTKQLLFTFNSEAVNVSFEHPLDISLINRDKRQVIPQCGNDGQIGGQTICPSGCGNTDEGSDCNPSPINGAHINSSRPYVVRVEMQYKGEALPNGTPVNVQLFKNTDPSLIIKSSRVSIREGVYNTISIQEPLLNINGEETEELIDKSVVDIEIPCPTLPEKVDLYVSINYLGLFVDAIHSISFLGSLFIKIQNNQGPVPNGIDVAEQSVEVWTVDPDDPTNRLLKTYVEDGTLVKWELLKLRHGKDRPFYSTETINQLVSGTFSSVRSGFAQNVFFGPISNIESHSLTICDSLCCLGEEYAIKASVIYGEESAVDQVYIAYRCKEDEDRDLAQKFFMNAASNQFGQYPNYITWADGESLLKFQIAKDPSLILDSEIPGAQCFRDCMENKFDQPQLFEFPEGHIVQITAPGEILWNVKFAANDATGQLGSGTGVDTSKIISYESTTLLPNKSTTTAGIPITGDVTDYYVRLNKFVGEQSNPQPEDCDQSTGAGIGGDGTVTLSCEWNNICEGTSGCTSTGIRWKNVNPIFGFSTLISDNISITLSSGGGYENGIPPILVGFKEPLEVSVIESRVNGERLQHNELVVDGISQHTVVVEVKFANKSVPDGTLVEVSIGGANRNIVKLSNCSSPIAKPGCEPTSNGIIYTNLVNDPFINPTGDKRSLAYFTIDPLPNIAFNARINIVCKYDKLGTAERSITRCVELNNTVNVETQEEVIPPETPIPSISITSNDAIIYDTSNDFYSIVIGNNINRIGHFIASDSLSSSIYLFGGNTDRDLDGSSRITATCEKLNLSSGGEWSFITDMPTPRSNGMTITANNNIYCIGGIELDPIVSRYTVSRKIEAFNTVTELWNPSLTSMPEDYGVAFGAAFYDGSDNIYILCGITSVINNNQPKTLNDRIARYRISTDEWTLILSGYQENYARLSPFSFYRSNPIGGGSQQGYIYSGSIPKSLSEINADFSSQLNKALNDFRTFLLTSDYYISLTSSEQSKFISNEEARIKNNIIVPPYTYLASGFKFTMGTESDIEGELVLDLSEDFADEWTILPLPRDRGQCVYIPEQDAAYFMGGANQNKSTTLNRVESITLANAVNIYQKLTSFSRGRSLFGAVAIGEDIYLTGGLTSGHREGFVQIDVLQNPVLIEAQGKQSSGIVVVLKNDSGEIIEEDVRCMVSGRVRIPEIDSVLSNFLANRTATRILESSSQSDNLSSLIDLQNKIANPNSDQFQFNASKKLKDQLTLFPVLYSQQEFTIHNGIGGVTLLPRSEDPLADFERLSQFINETLNTTADPSTEFEGLSRDELLALGDALKTVKLPPVILDSNTVRKLYEIETIVTIIDNAFFGQSVSDFDLNIQEEITQKVINILIPPLPTPPPEDNPTAPSAPVQSGGTAVSGSDCLLLQHIAASEISPSDQPPPPRNNVGSNITGGFSQSGQCLFCQALFPLKPAIKPQSGTSVATFYNSTDWVPQIKKRLVDGHTIEEAIAELDIIDHEVPFGSSQLYNAMKEAAAIATTENFEDQKKVFYIGSDNSENFSTISRDAAIAEVNSIDGPGKCPIVYTVFSTSFPVSLSSQLERNEVGDIEKIVKNTGGQSSVLVSSSFMNDILNRTIGGATGGLGWGKYKHTLNLGSLRAITDVTTDFDLPSNTQGFLRFRHTVDGYNFNDWSEQFSGSQTVDFVDFFARLIEFEVILTTGFTEDISEEYDAVANGIPRLNSIVWGTSVEKEDFIFLNPEIVLTNVQQLAAAYEGNVPSSSSIEIGVSSSLSSDWRDYQSSARPALEEFGKIFLLNRTESLSTTVQNEPLQTKDGLLYKAEYGAWDPSSVVNVFEVKNQVKIPILTGFQPHPRQGELYFDHRQSIDKIFIINVLNSDKMRVGVRIRNRLHTDAVSLRGVGYIYSTNNEKPLELSQVAPRAINAFISPSSPISQDIFAAIYTYIDLNGDKETGSVIKWYKNGLELFELQNKRTWKNTDLINSNKLTPNDKIHFSITPSDGRDFGLTVISPAAIIAAQPPNAESLRIISLRGNLINERYDTSSIFEARYQFTTDDQGVNAKEKDTEIKWYVNGSLFKIAKFSEGGAVTLKQLSFTETGSEPGSSQGLNAHIIGNEIVVEVTPKTAIITGSKMTSIPLTVVNSVPIALNVIITPSQPTGDSTLQLAYTLDDKDISVQNSTQTDQSEIKWLVSDNGSAYIEKIELRNDKNIPPFFLVAGQTWKAQVIGFDGLDRGPTVTSNIVLIRSA